MKRTLSAFHQLKAKAESLGYKVKLIPNGKLGDYVGMNPLAAKELGFQMPEDEIWLKENITMPVKYHTLKHELVEMVFMKQGLMYYPAHERALKVEALKSRMPSLVNLRREAMVKKARVFAVPGDETMDGKPEVIYAKDGDLNHGTRKTFATWDEATTFAAKKGQELKAETTIHDSSTNPTIIRDFSKGDEHWDVKAIVKGRKFDITSTPRSKKEALHSQKMDRELGHFKSTVLQVGKNRFVTGTELKNQSAIPHVTLKPRQPIKLVKMHDDGDMTLKQGGKLHVVTTDHKVFRELSRKQAQATGLTSIKHGPIYHTPVKGGVMLSRHSLRRGRR